MWQILATTMLVSGASAQPVELSVSGNLGFGAPAGLASVMARVDLYRTVFVEADAGLGIAGREIGGGAGFTIVEDRSKIERLGWARARLTGSFLVTRSHTTEREAGIPGSPWPELVQGAGTYTWGYLMTGGDIKLDNHLYILAEVGLAMRLAHDATYPMDPKPDDIISGTIRGGIGATF